MFQTCNNKGFKIYFPNGLALSTQFGYGNYCENNSNIELYEAYITLPSHMLSIASVNSEVAIIHTESGKFVTSDVIGCEEDVKGYVGIEEWLNILDKARNWAPI